MKKKHSTRTIAIVAAVAAGLLTLSACSSSDSSGTSTNAADGESLEIGMMIPGPAPYYSVVAKAAQEEADKLGVNLTVTNAQGSLADENAQLQQFVAQRKDAIIVIASQSNGTSASVRQANSAGIPVIASQTQIEDADTITYVGADNVEFGRKLADATVQAMGKETGNVAIVLGALGNSAQIDRLQGFEEQITDKYPGITIVDKQTANWDNNQALQVSQDFLSKYPKGTLDAVVGQGPETITGATFARANGREEIKWIVGDIPEAVSTGIEDGTLDAAVYQDPRTQGQYAVQDAVAAARGETADIPNPHLSPISIVTKENLAEINPYTY